MKDSLKKIFNLYEKDANIIQGWKSMTKTELANGYCHYDELEQTPYNKSMKEHYFSALMCKYSYMITYMYSKRQSVLKRLDIEDYHDWVVESLLVGLKYRRWRDPKFKDLYNNPNGAEVVFNRCFYSIEKKYYKYYNQDCRKLGFIALSLEDEIDSSKNENNEDSGKIHLKDTIDEYNVTNEAPSICRDIVQYYLNKGKILEALIVDGIGYQSVFKKTKYNIVEEIDGKKTGVSRKEEFSPKELVNHLVNLDSYFMNYFNKTYSVNRDALANCIEKIETTKRNKLYSIIDNTLVEVKNMMCA